MSTHSISRMVLIVLIGVSAFATCAETATPNPNQAQPPNTTQTNAGCTVLPCKAPNQKQADALFAKIEQLYPQYFSPKSVTQQQKKDQENIFYRNYSNNYAAGLGTYQGDLWYTLGGQWTRYGSLDDANKTFCNSACWGDSSNAPAFTMYQTLSDGAQRTTLAFSGLAMMTGNLQAQSFFPPGKVADYTGFQYLRDNDPDNMGHNTSFLTRVANNVIYTLNDAQFSKLITLATSQQEQINLYGYKRYPLMKAFRRLLDGDIPTGSSGLNLHAVKKASRELYLIDGQISFDRAILYADLINSLSSTQKTYFANMKGKGWKSWPDITDDQIKLRMSKLPQGSAVAVMTYASDLYSWYAGSIDADVYFCPERQGTYYGSFYIKDAPAIGHEGYGIDEQLTATAGSVLSDSSKGYVTQTQADLMSSLVEKQKDNLYASATSNIVKVRTEIATQLRNLMLPNANASTIKAKVLEQSGIYGDLDGENNYVYATVFAQVYKSLSSEQKSKLAALRKSIMSGNYADGTVFDYSISTNYYLYSEVIKDINLLSPYIANTDYLFFEP